MTIQFQDLEDLLPQKFELDSTAALAAKKEQYQDAPLEEILETLESLKTVFITLASELPPQLKQSARQEISFLNCILIFKTSSAQLRENKSL